MKKKKTLFDEDIVIDESLFNNFKISDIASWSHLMLWCTIKGIDVNYAFFKGILCGISVFKKLYDIVLDAILTTDFIDKYLCNIEVIEIIEKLFNDAEESRTFKAKEFWLELAYQQDYDNAYSEYFNTGTIYENKQKYKLLNAIFSKNPLLLVKFYDKHKMAVHAYDMTFERWLLKRCDLLSKNSKLFAEIHKAMSAEIHKLNKLSMHMN